MAYQLIKQEDIDALNAAHQRLHQSPSKENVRLCDEALMKCWPNALLLALEQLKVGEPYDLELIVKFLEEDPIFFRSGYAKEEMITLIKRTDLPEWAKSRLRVVCLQVVKKGHRREFRRYCNLAATIADENFVIELSKSLVDVDKTCQRNAAFMRAKIAQLTHKNQIRR